MADFFDDVIKEYDKLSENPTNKYINRIVGGGLSLIGSLLIPPIVDKAIEGDIDYVPIFVSSFFLAEGLGMLISGKLHYSSVRVCKYIKKGIQYLSDL